MEKMKVYVKFIGGKWEEGKRCFSFSFHWPPNNGTFQRPPSNGTFQGPPSIGTFHWPLSWDLFSLPSFSFSLRRRIQIIEALFLRNNFQFKSWKYLFPQPCWGRKEWLVLINGRKKECRLNICNSFEKMEVNMDSVERLKSQKSPTNPLEFGSITSYWYSCRT